MTVDATLPPNQDVMASVDSSPAGDEFIIADVGRDDAWLSVSATEATGLEEWR